MSREPYDSDVTDVEWLLLEPLIPPEKHGGRHRTVDIREVVNAIFYGLRTGCAWRLLPHDFPAWQTVYGYFRDWRKTGVWEQLNTALREAVREQEEREAEPSAAIMDSQSVKTTAVAGERGYDAAKKVTGRKRHILVDVLGLLLTVVVTKASVPEREGAKTLLKRALAQHFERLALIWADYRHFLAFNLEKEPEYSVLRFCFRICRCVRQTPRYPSSFLGRQVASRLSGAGI